MKILVQVETAHDDPAKAAESVRSGMVRAGYHIADVIVPVPSYSGEYAVYADGVVEAYEPETDRSANRYG